MAGSCRACPDLVRALRWNLVRKGVLEEWMNTERRYLRVQTVVVINASRFEKAVVVRDRRREQGSYHVAHNCERAPAGHHCRIRQQVLWWEEPRQVLNRLIAQDRLKVSANHACEVFVLQLIPQVELHRRLCV